MLRMPLIGFLLAECRIVSRIQEKFPIGNRGGKDTLPILARMFQNPFANHRSLQNRSANPPVHCPHFLRHALARSKAIAYH
jgi:hypothetical protein